MRGRHDTSRQGADIQDGRDVIKPRGMDQAHIKNARRKPLLAYRGALNHVRPGYHHKCPAVDGIVAGDWPCAVSGNGL